MNTVNENALEFMKSELKKAQIEVSEKESGREAVDFIFNTNGNSYQLFFKSIDAVTERSIKIPKQDLGENEQPRSRASRYPLNQTNLVGSYDNSCILLNHSLVC